MKSLMNPRWRIWDSIRWESSAIADIVENKYGISLDDERIAGVRTLSDFKDLVVLKIAEVA